MKAGERLKTKFWILKWNFFEIKKKEVIKDQEKHWIHKRIWFCNQNDCGITEVKKIPYWKRIKNTRVIFKKSIFKKIELELIKIWGTTKKRTKMKEIAMKPEPRKFFALKLHKIFQTVSNQSYLNELIFLTKNWT